MRGYIDAMKEVEAADVKKVPEADKILAKTIPDLSLRQFLLTNLKHTASSPHLRFRINLAALDKHLDEVWKWHPPAGAKYDGKTLFIPGSRSNYVRPEMHSQIYQYFPNAEIKPIDAGHW
ncbi:hypothetical protein HDV00_001572 [Rhizophlyctis rosea]|nr:hypothetical protein HDV00_001572 [Rhizophlyctis rosea]